MSKSKSKQGRQEQGIRITREEVESAFNFFDVAGRGVLRPKDLKARLSAFYPNMTNKEYRFLISEPNFTVDTLWNLLENNNITNFDPVKEAFKVPPLPLLSTNLQVMESGTRLRPCHRMYTKGVFYLWAGTWALHKLRPEA